MSLDLSYVYFHSQVVELQSAEENQAQALYLVLKLSQTTCELYNQFLAIDTYKLLRHVVSSAKTPPGFYVLKVGHCFFFIIKLMCTKTLSFYSKCIIDVIFYSGGNLYKQF